MYFLCLTQKSKFKPGHNFTLFSAEKTIRDAKQLESAVVVVSVVVFGRCMV